MELITPAEFSANYELNLKEHIEVKGGSFQARYISWAIAQKLLREKHPTLSVDFERAASGDILHHLGDNIYLLPFLTNGKDRTPAIFFPVMDNRFSAISSPCVMAVNKAFQRATAKVIAVYTGLGLSLFTNEDLEDLEEPVNHPKTDSKEFVNGDGWENTTLSFSKKYPTQTLREIAKENPSYLEFMLSPKSKFEIRDEKIKAHMEKAIEWAKTGVIEPPPTTKIAKLEDLPGEEVIDPNEEKDDVPF